MKLKMYKTKLLFTFILSLTFLFYLSNVCFAATWSQYAKSNLYGVNNARGLKGDYKIPSINSNWSSTYYANFIAFTEWLPINGTTGDWLELGYMDGAIDPEGDGNEDYTGCYRAKKINGVYSEAKLNVSVSVGNRYTFTIVDYNAQNLWEIYIGSTYLGNFSTSVGPGSGDTLDQGYENNIQPGSPTPTVGSTDILNQSYRLNGSWSLWDSSLVGLTDTSQYVNITYNSQNKSSTFTSQ